MREERKRRLEARGWRFGTPAELLGLSLEEEAYIEIRSRLATGLKRRRIRRRMTQAELATVIRSSQSRVAKMEAADATVSVDLLLRALFALGAKRRDIAVAIQKGQTAAA